MPAYCFERAELSLGEGVARRRHVCAEVTLTVTEAPPSAPILPGIRSDFLNGRLQVTGELVEVCLPSASLLKRGLEAGLKLSAHGKWSTVQILVVDLLDVRPLEPKQRLYRWSFIVVGQTHDPLKLFPAARDGELLAIDDLLSLLGATRQEVGGAAFDGEGGFSLE